MYELAYGLGDMTDDGDGGAVNAENLSGESDDPRGGAALGKGLERGALSRGGGVERPPYNDVGRRDNPLSVDRSVDMDRDVWEVASEIDVESEDVDEPVDTGLILLSVFERRVRIVPTRSGESSFDDASN